MLTYVFHSVIAASVLITCHKLFSFLCMSCIGGLGGIGMGLGPGGQPINANRLNSGGSVGSMGPGGQLPV